MTKDSMTNRMIVAVDIIGSQEYREFIYKCFTEIITKYPQHTYLFISGKPFETPFRLSENIIKVVVKQAKISLLQQFKISSLLKKHKANVFVTEKLLSTNIPQCLIALDKTTIRSLKKATVIVADSEFSKKKIIEKYNIAETTVDVVYNGVDEIFRPVDFEEKEKNKEQHADSNEYFLSTVTTKPDLLNLLKAFSVFKKMQKSNMQLLISFPAEMNKEFSEALRLYKFKSEVKLPGDIGDKELAGIMGAAYAFVYPAGEYVHILPAMRSGTPVITNNTGALQETGNDAAVYFRGNDHKDIADKMMLVYKDENLRQQLIDKGIEQVKKFSWDNAAGLLWKSIQKAAN